MKYIFLSLSVLFNISAYIIFKTISGKEHSVRWYALFLIGLLLGAVNVYFFTRSLKEIDLGIAYPVFSAASISIIILLSFFLFRERLTIINVIGAIIVMAGIFLLTK